MPFRVVAAGAGVAGLELALALRALAEDLVSVELIAPEREFTYRPLAVAEPFRRLRSSASRSSPSSRRPAPLFVPPASRRLSRIRRPSGSRTESRSTSMRSSSRSARGPCRRRRCAHVPRPSGRPGPRRAIGAGNRRKLATDRLRRPCRHQLAAAALRARTPHRAVPQRPWDARGRDRARHAGGASACGVRDGGERGDPRAARDSGHRAPDRSRRDRVAGRPPDCRGTDRRSRPTLPCRSLSSQAPRSPDFRTTAADSSRPTPRAACRERLTSMQQATRRSSGRSRAASPPSRRTRLQRRSP